MVLKLIFNLVLINTRVEQTLEPNGHILQI
jgi:hypothetical protein